MNQWYLLAAQVAFIWQVLMMLISTALIILSEQRPTFRQTSFRSALAYAEIYQQAAHAGVRFDVERPHMAAKLPTRSDSNQYFLCCPGDSARLPGNMTI
jgi:hypothetical protein